MKKILILTLSTLCSLQVMSQRRQHVMISALGTTPLIGVKYDTRFFENVNDGIGANVGFGSIEVIDDGEHKASFAIGPNWLFGKGQHQLLLGVNAVFVLSREYPLESEPQNKVRTMFIPDIGYRFSSKGKGFTGQVTWNPLRSNLDRESAYQYFGVGVGYCW